MDSYRDLIVLQKSIRLVEEVYNIVKSLPKEELYALSDQMRRSVVSIPSNIAEGYERNTTREYLRFLSIAQGSRAELETQLEICVRLAYLSAEQVNLALSLCNEVGKMLGAIIRKLGNTRYSNPYPLTPIP